MTEVPKKPAMEEKIQRQHSLSEYEIHANIPLSLQAFVVCVFFSLAFSIHHFTVDSLLVYDGFSP